MTPPITSLARNEIRIEDGTIVEITAGDIWLEFENTDAPSNSTPTNRFKITDIVTDAIRVDPLDAEEGVPIDYDLDEFRDKASSGTLIPNSQYSADSKDNIDATEIAEVIAQGVNTSINPTLLGEEFASKHNWLQNEAFYSVLKPLTIALATMDQTDRRNQDAVDEAQEIVACMGWNETQYLNE